MGVGAKRLLALEDDDRDALELGSWKTSPMRTAAWMAGASVGVSETACSRSTTSSGGTATVASTASASHPRMISGEKVRMKDAIRGRDDRCVSVVSVVMRPARGKR